MKKYINQTTAWIILGGLAIIAVLIWLVISFRSSSTTTYDSQNEQSGPYTNNTIDMESNENNLRTEVNDATDAYIYETYPNAVITNRLNEYITGDASVVLVTFTNNNQENEKRVYVINDGTNWYAIHETEGIISCETVNELVNRQTILNDICES